MKTSKSPPNTLLRRCRFIRCTNTDANGRLLSAKEENEWWPRRQWDSNSGFSTCETFVIALRQPLCEHENTTNSKLDDVYVYLHWLCPSWAIVRNFTPKSYGTRTIYYPGVLDVTQMDISCELTGTNKIQKITSQENDNLKWTFPNAHAQTLSDLNLG